MQSNALVAEMPLTLDSAVSLLHNQSCEYLRQRIQMHGCFEGITVGSSQVEIALADDNTFRPSAFVATCAALCGFKPEVIVELVAQCSLDTAGTMMVSPYNWLGRELQNRINAVSSVEEICDDHDASCRRIISPLLTSEGLEVFDRVVGNYGKKLPTWRLLIGWLHACGELPAITELQNFPSWFGGDNTPSWTRSFILPSNTGGPARSSPFVFGASDDAAAIAAALLLLQHLNRNGIAPQPLLFHGTSWNSALNIVQLGIDVDVDDETRVFATFDFGKGFYLARDIELAIEFSCPRQPAILIFGDARASVSLADYVELRGAQWENVIRHSYTTGGRVHASIRPSAIVEGPICINPETVKRGNDPKAGTIQVALRKDSISSSYDAALLGVIAVRQDGNRYKKILVR